MPIDGHHLIGLVHWYGPGRKYCFFPIAETVFEQVCLREIAAFCEDQTKLHRESKKTLPRDQLRVGLTRDAVCSRL